MRKIILATAFVAMTLVGCGAKEADNTTIKNDSSVLATNENNIADQSGKDSVDSYLPNTFKVPSKEIYADGPNYQEIEEGFTRLFIVHEQKYCAFTAALKANAISLLEAHDVSFAKLQQNMMNYEGGINSIQIDQEQNLTVNGIDTYYFEGTINYGTDNIHDGYAAGYAFILDGVPYEIIGSVIDNEQSSVTIQEIKDNVDAMMKSVRTTK